MGSSIHSILRSKYLGRNLVISAMFFVLVFGGPVPGPSKVATGKEGQAVSPSGEPAFGDPEPEGRIAKPRMRIREASYGRRPLSFEARPGQTNDRASYLCRGSGYDLILNSAEAVFALRTTDRGMIKDGPLSRGPSLSMHASSSPAPAIFRMSLVRSNPAASAEGVDPLPGKSNYFSGDDPRNWRIGIPNYAKMKFHDVYPGVDLVYYGSQEQLEFDFVVAAGADPAAIQLAFSGAEKLKVDAQGDLSLQTSSGEVRLQRPIVYQEAGAQRVEVDGQIRLVAHPSSPVGSLIGFELGAYDRSKPLVIDPVLAYSSYLGGRGDDKAFDIAVDNTGNVYVVGSTTSLNFPTTTPQQPNFGGETDAFVTKLSPTGTVVYSTYLGGRLADVARGVAVDAAGSAYVVGFTTSTNFPVVNPLQRFPGGAQDVFVAKLNPTGSALIYSSYLGGSNDESGIPGIQVDSMGNVYVAGGTSSTNFPTFRPLQPASAGGEDAFVAKINSVGSTLIYSTYLGGRGDEEARGLAVDLTGNAYVAGRTSSTNFPMANAFQPGHGGGIFDSFLTKLNAAGSSLIYATYLGGNRDDQASRVAIDGAGNAYVVGFTASSNFPTANSLQSSFGGGACGTNPEGFTCGDAFLTKVNATGSALVYSTYLGGSRHELGFGVAADVQGNAYVTGITNSTNFPTVNPLQLAFSGGTCGADPSTLPCFDLFVAAINPTGSAFIYSTYLGGTGEDLPIGIAVDLGGNAYVAGYTSSTNFPTVGPAQPGFGGGPCDAFIVELVGR